MPELPEVETIKNGLKIRILNKKIKKIWIEDSFQKRIFPSKGKFLDLVRNKLFQNIERRGKLLIFSITKDLFVLVHLKMTGQLVYKSKEKIISGGHPMKNIDHLPNRFTRVIFYFSDGKQLFFNDLRKFGYLKLVNKIELEEILGLYGFEPLGKSFTYARFDKLLKKKARLRVKPWLLDQRQIAGLGNIYSDEVCCFAKVMPDRLVKDLTEKEINLIHAGIIKILTASIKAQGTTFSNYVNANGESGAYTKQLKVYGRYGQKCYNCSGKIEKMKIGGRTASYCPRCQK